MASKLVTAAALARAICYILMPQRRVHRFALRLATSDTPANGRAASPVICGPDVNGRASSPGIRRADVNGRAARAILRLADALSLRLRCLRKASVLFLASARGGEPVTLVYGIRRSREGNGCGGFIGHAWVERMGSRVEDLRRGHPLVLAFPGGTEHFGWRRG